MSTRHRSPRSGSSPITSPRAANRRPFSGSAPSTRNSGSASPICRRPLTSRAAGDPVPSARFSKSLTRYDAEPILEHGNPIGLKQGDASVSLEPAGQLELSGGPLETLHETRAELEAHLEQVRAVGREIGLGFAPLGFHPIETRAGHALDAQGPLCDHAPVHAEGRLARSRHDDAHLHGAGQSRLSVRGRYGSEAARIARAAAGGDGAFRQLSVHRRAARTAISPTGRISGAIRTMPAPAFRR